MTPFVKSFKYLVILILATIFMLMSFVYKEKDILAPPKAKVITSSFTLCGEELTDDYFWLRNMEDPDVLRYIREENSYTDLMMRHTQPLQQRIFEEIKSRTNENDTSVPEKLDSYFYYYKTVEGKQYPLFCRKKESLNFSEEILIDQNELEKEFDFLHIDRIKVSPDHNLIAYSIDTTGYEEYSIMIKNLDFDIVSDTILFTSGNFEWANDSKSIFYTVMDSTKRPYRLYNHKIGVNLEDDVLIYEEKEPYFLDVEKTKDKKYLLVSLETISSSEVRYMDANDTEYKLYCIKPRRENILYSVEHRFNKFYIYTNEDAENFKIIELPAGDLSRTEQRDVVPHRENISLEEFDIFKDHIVLYEREGGLPKLRVLNLNSYDEADIKFEEPVYTLNFHRNPVFDTNILRFEYSSFSTPNTTIDYNMETGEKEIKKVLYVKNFSKEDYVSERIFADGDDGVKIPISLFYKRGLNKYGNNPMLLTGYGAYGINSEAQFSPRLLSLVDRGLIYAVAHIRGGSELGRRWYDEGKLLKKENTFNDFICCAEYLMSEKFTSAEKLVITGGSAGGLLIGAVLNRAPELCKAAVAIVPFVDVINTMRDTSLPLTVHEYDEWGNPNDEKYFKLMRSYSPYDNVGEKYYPNLLITAGLYDARVPYWEPVKWAAKLRALKKDDNLLLLKVNMGSGHGGVSGRYDYIRETAFQYAFILDRLNITE